MTNAEVRAKLVESRDKFAISLDAIEASFYAYAYPAPKGFNDYPIQPPAAFYSPEMQEFILPYAAYV